MLCICFWVQNDLASLGYEGVTRERRQIYLLSTCTAQDRHECKALRFSVDGAEHGSCKGRKGTSY